MGIIDTITADLGNGYTATINIHPDPDHGAPWDNEDGHGPVSDWTTREKAPGEWVLCEDRRSFRYYDAAEAVAIARRDGWGTSEGRRAKLAAKLGRNPTKGDIAAEAVRLNFEYLRRWAAGDWFYVGYTLAVESPDGEMVGEDSCWGFDSDSRDYITGYATDAAHAIAREHAAGMASAMMPALPL